LALKEPWGVVQPQQSDSGAANRRFPYDMRRAQSKMLAPRLYAWVEQGYRYLFHWINCRDIGTFAQVALCTSQSKVFAHGLPTMFARNEVVNVVGKFCIVLMNQAVFTTPPRSFDNQSAKRRRKAKASHRNSIAEAIGVTRGLDVHAL
jgi:hypothetical protein